MIRIEFPAEKPRLSAINGEEFIFCLIRKKWLKVTPEEWVRQNFIIYLNRVLNYPLPLIAVEKTIRVGELSRRFDIVVYGKEHRPQFLVECKEMNVPLTEQVIRQALAYNLSVLATIIIITNGANSVAIQRKGTEITFLESIPPYTN